MYQIMPIAMVMKLIAMTASDKPWSNSRSVRHCMTSASVNWPVRPAIQSENGIIAPHRCNGGRLRAGETYRQTAFKQHRLQVCLARRAHQQRTRGNRFGKRDNVAKFP